MPSQEAMTLNPRMTLMELFETHKGLPVHKFPHHIEIYDRLFAELDMPDPTLLEIGVAHGGSMALWRDYFGPAATIIGVDVQDRTAIQQQVDAKIFTGDQADPTFWQLISSQIRPLHIVIDDGSHRSADQLATFNELFPILEDGGLYIIEDIHTSYRPDYGGGLGLKGSVVETLKDLIDVIHNTEYGGLGDSHVFSVQVYPNLAVIQKKNPSTWGGSTMRPIHAD